MATVRRRVPLHVKILLGAVLGIIAGIVAQESLGKNNPDLKMFSSDYLDPIGNIFFHLILMVVVPLLFSALVVGVSELGDAKRVGRVGILSLVMTVLLSGTAVGIGLLAVNIFNPAHQLTATQRTELIAQYSDVKEGEKRVAQGQKAVEDPPLLGFISKNPFKEINRALEGGLMPFMFFALLFGIALASIEPEKAAPVKAFFEGTFAVSLKIIDFAMFFAPVGVFCLLFVAFSKIGIGLLSAMLGYVVLVLVCLAIHQFGTYSLALKFIAKRNPLEFFRQVRGTMATAFATSSSNVTLPVALKDAEEKVGLPPTISRFVLTIGATANQNGTALFEGITIIFLASMFGVELTLAQQLQVMGLAIVAGIGTAGVPGGAWPMIAIILNSYFKVPPAAIGLAFGIDRILDMSRTVLNVTGDITIAACVTQLDGGRAREDARLAGFEAAES
jgi:dicarboxylate/amino acid:cation (Na+ or H+) symporter, DAACS family